METTAIQSAMGFLQKALPWIGAAATGNVPALIGLAASKVSEALGSSVTADATSIARAVAGASPDQLIALQTKELEVKDHAMQMGFENAQEMARIGLQQDTLITADVADARKNNSNNDQTWMLAWVIMITFALVMALVLYGCFAILQGSITIKDVSVVAAIAGLVGSVVGYVAANTQTVINFLYGGSLGSRNNANSLSNGIQSAISAIGNKK